MTKIKDERTISHRSIGANLLCRCYTHRQLIITSFISCNFYDSAALFVALNTCIKVRESFSKVSL